MAGNSHNPDDMKTLKVGSGLHEPTDPAAEAGSNDLATLNMKNQTASIQKAAGKSDDPADTDVNKNNDSNDFTDVKHAHLLGREYNLNDSIYKIVGVIAFNKTGEANIFLVEDRKEQRFVLKMYKSNIEVKRDILDTVKSIDHPHVVYLHEYGTTGDGAFYELMEVAEGGISFDKAPITDADDLKKIILQTASALDYCHRRKLVHRDIKPENLLLRNKEDIHILIADFGISSMMHQDENHHTTGQGFTYQYAAPEVLSYSTGKIIVGPAVDYYSLGLSILTLFLGESWALNRPPAVITNMINQSRIPIPETMPKDIAHAVSGLLTHQEAQRWGYNELKRWADGEDVPVARTVLQNNITDIPPFDFMHHKGKILKAHDPNELAELVYEHREQGIKRLYRNDIGDWIKPQIPIMESRLDDIIEAYPREEGKENEGILSAYYVMSSRKSFIDKNWKRHDLSACIDKEEMLDAIGDLLDNSDTTSDYLESDWLEIFMRYNDLEDAFNEIQNEILIPYRKKEFPPRKATHKLVLKLQKGDTFRMYGVDYTTFSELNDAPAYVKNDLAKEIHESNSKFLCWLEEMFLKSDSLDISLCETTELVALIHKMPWLKKYDSKLNNRLNKRDDAGYTDLMRMAGAGELAICRDLVASGADIHYADNDGNTAFIVAAMAQQTEVMEYLYTQKVEINPIDKKGSPLIHNLSRENLSLSIQFLLDHGVSIECKRESDGWTPLFEAVSFGAGDAIGLLLDAGANPDIIDKNKRSPLHTLTAHEDTESMELLLQKGADPNAGDASDTPLHYAAHNNKIEALKTLLKYGADPNSGSKERWTALPQAAAKNNIECVKLLLQAGADPGIGIHDFDSSKNRKKELPPALYQAIIKKNWECAKLLVEHKAPLDFTYHGYGYLGYLHNNMEGCEKEVLELMELMLSKGLNPNRNSEDNKLLFTCIETSNFELFELLLKYRMNPDIQLDDKKTPLLQAVFKGASHIQFTESLLKHKANPYIPAPYDKDNTFSAFSYCAKYLGPDFIQLFLLHGANPMKSAKYDPDGDSPLHYAIIGTQKENIKLLSSKRGWRNKKNKRGLTPFMYAGWMRDEWTVKYLYDMGINYKAKDKDGDDAFDIAASREYPIDKYMRQICNAPKNARRFKSIGHTRRRNRFSCLRDLDYFRILGLLVRIPALIILAYTYMYAARNGYFLNDVYPIEHFYNDVFGGGIILHIAAAILTGWLLYHLPLNDDDFYDDNGWIKRSLKFIFMYGWIPFIPELLILPEIIGIPTTSWMAPLYTTGWQQHIWGALHAESIIPFLTAMDSWPIIGDWLARPQMTVVQLAVFGILFGLSRFIYYKED